ncbi:hypothetical protein JCM8097_003533 [Rhodosporidiobolus ruineniae]
MKVFVAALAALSLISSTTALPADNGVSIAKVGDKPDVEIVDTRARAKRDALPNPKAQEQRTRPDWRQPRTTTTTTVRTRPNWRDPRPSTSSSTRPRFVPAPTSAPIVATTTTPAFVPAPTTTPVVATTTSAAVVSNAGTSGASGDAGSAGGAQATVSNPVPTTTTTTSAAPGSTAGLNIRDAALNEHNRFRALHAAPALTWNQNLADAAGRWAANCVFQHSQGAVGPYGENLASNAGTGQTTLPTTTIVNGLIKLWEDEAPDYNPANPVYSHFTQMVWKSTTELGCVLQVCPPGTLFDAQYGNANYLVCEYNPPGNVYPSSNFLANVTP